jgi:hypothetical protein
MDAHSVTVLLATALLETARLERVPRIATDRAEADIADETENLVAENLKDTAVKELTAAVDMATAIAAANAIRKDMAAKAVADIRPAEDETTSPAVKTTGVKAGKTSVTTTPVKADMAATVASQADNAVMEKAQVATVRDREVTRIVPTIRQVTDQAKAITSPAAAMITTEVMIEAKIVAGGIVRLTKSRHGLATKRQSAAGAWMRNIAVEGRKITVDPTNELRKT